MINYKVPTDINKAGGYYVHNAVNNVYIPTSALLLARDKKAVPVKSQD